MLLYVLLFWIAVSAVSYDPLYSHYSYTDPDPENPTDSPEYHRINKKIEEGLWPDKFLKPMKKSLFTKIKERIFPPLPEGPPPEQNVYMKIYEDVESMAGGFYQWGDCYLPLFHYSTVKFKNYHHVNFDKNSPMVVPFRIPNLPSIRVNATWGRWGVVVGEAYRTRDSDQFRYKIPSNKLFLSYSYDPYRVSQITQEYMKNNTQWVEHGSSLPKLLG